MKRDKILAKLLETLVIKALKQEGKEPTTENIEAFIDDALKEIEPNVDEKCKTCDKCKYYLYRSNEYPCSRCRRNNVLVDEIRGQQNDRWKDGTTNG